MIDFAGLVGRITGKGVPDGGEPGPSARCSAGVATGGEFAALVALAAKSDTEAGQASLRLVVDNDMPAVTSDQQITDGAQPVTLAGMPSPDALPLAEVPTPMARLMVARPASAPSVPVAQVDDAEIPNTDPAPLAEATTPGQSLKPTPASLPAADVELVPVPTPVAVPASPLLATPASGLPVASSPVPTRPGTVMASSGGAPMVAIAPDAVPATDQAGDEPAAPGSSEPVASDAHKTDEEGVHPTVAILAPAMAPPIAPIVANLPPQVTAQAENRPVAGTIVATITTAPSTSAPIAATMSEDAPVAMAQSEGAPVDQQPLARRILARMRADPAPVVQPQASPAKTDAPTPGFADDNARTESVTTPSIAASAYVTDTAPLAQSLRAIVDGLPPVLQSELGAASVRGVAGPSTGEVLGERVIDMGVSGQWIDRMAREIAGLAEGNGHSRFTLNPPHLGRLEVNLWTDQDTTNIRMVAETDEAARRLTEGRTALQADARMAALSLGTITVEKASAPFDANARDQGQSSPRQGSDLSGQAQQQQQQAGEQGQSRANANRQGDWVRPSLREEPVQSSDATSSSRQRANGRVRFA